MVLSAWLCFAFFVLCNLNWTGLVRTSVAFCHGPVFQFMTLSYNYSLSMEHFWPRILQIMKYSLLSLFLTHSLSLALSPSHTHIHTHTFSLNLTLSCWNTYGKSLWVGWRFIRYLIIILFIFFKMCCHDFHATRTHFTCLQIMRFTLHIPPGYSIFHQTPSIFHLTPSI